MLKNQKGFTLIELVMVVGFFGAVLVAGGMIYAAIHFISKFW